MYYIRMRVTDLTPGDFLDLADDPYADPACDDAALESGCVEVSAVERETDDCVLIRSESAGRAWGFPSQHLALVYLPDATGIVRELMADMLAGTDQNPWTLKSVRRAAWFVCGDPIEAQAKGLDFDLTGVLRDRAERGDTMGRRG